MFEEINKNLNGFLHSNFTIAPSVENKANRIAAEERKALQLGLKAALDKRLPVKVVRAAKTDGISFLKVNVAETAVTVEVI